MIKRQSQIKRITRDLVASLKHRGSKLKNAVVLLEKILVLSKGMENCRDCNKAAKVTQPVLSMITSSGLVLDEIFHWLDSVKEDSSDDKTLNDMIEMELMQEELYWQLTRVCKVVDEAVTSGEGTCTPDYQQEFLNISSLIKEILSECFCLAKERVA